MPGASAVLRLWQGLRGITTGSGFALGPVTGEMLSDAFEVYEIDSAEDRVMCREGVLELDAGFRHGATPPAEADKKQSEQKDAQDTAAYWREHFAQDHLDPDS